MSETIHQRIKRFRRSAGYLQSDVAKILNMKIDTYSKMERKGNITCKMLIELADIFQVDPRILLCGENDETEIILPDEDETTKEPVDIWGIPSLIADDIYEKFAVLAMRNFSKKRKQQLYQLILEEFKCIDNLMLRKYK